MDPLLQPFLTLDRLACRDCADEPDDAQDLNVIVNCDDYSTALCPACELDALRECADRGYRVSVHKPRCDECGEEHRVLYDDHSMVRGTRPMCEDCARLYCA